MNAIAPRHVDETVLRVFYDDIACEGNALKIVAPLDRQLYMKVDKILTALGGNWNKKAKAHLFPGDAAAALDPVLLTGTVAMPQDYGFFETPAPVAEIIIDTADIDAGMKVLEPSAGTGNLATLAARLTGWVDCVELQADKAATLRQRLAEADRDGLGQVWEGDFLSMAPASLSAPYDRVVMNPPFAKQADIKHVLHALSFLKPGGRLVSIMAAGVTFRCDRQAIAFRDLVDDLGGYIEDLPERAFRTSGTDINTCFVVLDKD